MPTAVKTVANDRRKWKKLVAQCRINLYNCPHNEVKLKQNSFKTVLKQF